MYSKKILYDNDPRVIALKKRQILWLELLNNGTLKSLDKNDPRIKNNNQSNLAQQKLRSTSQSGNLNNKVAGINFNPSQNLKLNGVSVPRQQSVLQQTVQLPLLKLLKGYTANGSTTYFDDTLEEKFNNIRNDFNLSKYWQDSDIDYDFYDVLYRAKLPEDSPLRKRMDKWGDNEWNTARDLFMQDPLIRQRELENMEKYWNDISTVTPVYKKGGLLHLEYRDWEKEMYDSYKCGGKTKKKACGGEMKPKKKACGGMKVKK